MEAETNGKLPLQDINVLEIGHVVAGPFCSLLLAELGANVVKIEHGATGGDSVRGSSSVGNSVFNTLNRNKRGISLDLKTDDGLETFKDLASKADVIVENLRPGAPEGLGVDYESIKECNERIIYCSIKGFNPGPYEEYPALDPVAEALSGLMSVTGHSDSPPARAGTSVADMAASLFGALGVVAAIRWREKTGEGQKITSPLFESNVALMNYWLVYEQAYDSIPEPLGAGHINWSPYNIYQTADDRWVFVGPSSQGAWERLCQALGVQYHEKERFATLADRRDNEAELDALLAEEIRTWSTDELVEALRDAGVSTAPVQNLSEVNDDPHLKATGAFTTIDTTEGPEKRVQVPVLPIRSTAYDPADATKPPALGEHTTEVLQEIGYSSEQIEQLREDGCL